MAMANILIFKRLKEKVAEQMSEQQQAGGQAHVITRLNGAVLSAKTGTYEFDLFDALEVPEGSNPELFGGNDCMPKIKARLGVIRGLGKLAVKYDRAIQKMLAKEKPG